MADCLVRSGIGRWFFQDQRLVQAIDGTDLLPSLNPGQQPQCLLPVAPSPYTSLV